MTRTIAWLMAAAPLVLASAPGLSARPADGTVTIRASAFPYVRTVDERFQSYQIGFSHLTGGDTWKALEAIETKPGHPRDFSSVREARAPTDLTNRRLRNLTAALAPFYLRYSGTTANNVWFQDNEGPAVAPPPGFKVVLTRQRWREALDFAEAVNAKVVTSFTVSHGVRDGDHNWTTRVAEPWMAYTRSIGRQVYAAELYNEPNAPEPPEVPHGVSVEQFGRDYATFSAFMGKAAPQVRLAGPGNATLGIPGVRSVMKPTPEDYARAEPRPRFDIFSYHFYPVLSQRCAPANSPQSITADRARDAEFLTRPEAQFLAIKGLRDQYAPAAPIWLTETGGAACGGLAWQQTFLDMARYLDTHARLAKAGLDAIFTHALISGNNGVIDEKTFQPNASYWAAVLWRRLMGTRILDAGPQRPGLHIYAHCLRGVPGGVALLAINLEDRERKLRLSGPAEVYAMTASEPLSRTVLLNGRELAVTPDDALPAMEPVRVRGRGIVLPALGNSFIALPKANNRACRITE